MRARETKLKSEADEVKNRRRGMRLATASRLPSKPRFTIAVCEKIFSAGDGPSPLTAFPEIKEMDAEENREVSKLAPDIGTNENSDHSRTVVAVAALITAGLVGFLIGRRN